MWEGLALALPSWPLTFLRDAHCYHMQPIMKEIMV